jgi:hypothetical protein
MGSKHLRTDVNLAWPSAEIAVMEPRRGERRLPPRNCVGGKPRRSARRQLDDSANASPVPSSPRKTGFVDDVIEPRHRPARDPCCMLRKPKVDTMPRKSTATFRSDGREVSFAASAATSKNFLIMVLAVTVDQPLPHGGNGPPTCASPSYAISVPPPSAGLSFSNPSPS